ncbi:MAG: efflux RND transporter periplasmic adaptor subunit [Defluviitaleaceae bacterium]|nr:efflux RND transporter periplasmic adaptor subunit [Defluviitaleaceae bacterium]
MRFLSGRKFILLLILSLFMLISCAEYDEPEVDVISVLLAEGILAAFEPGEVQQTRHNLTQVTRGDLIPTWNITLDVVFPRFETIRFEVENITPGGAHIPSEAWNYARFSGFPWRVGDLIEEGELIAELSYEMPLIIDMLRIELDIEEFERNFEVNYHNRVNEIAQLEIELELADQWEMAALRLARAKIGFQQFLIDSDDRREYFEERLEYFSSRFQPERLYSPVTGRVLVHTPHTQPGWYRYLPNQQWGGNIVGRRVMVLVDEEYYHFEAETYLHALRYGEIVPVQAVGAQVFMDRYGLDLTFHARVVSDPLATEGSRTGRDHRIILLPACEEEYATFREEVAMFEDNFFSFQNQFSLRALVDIPVALDAVIVDSRAVQTQGNQSFVRLYDNGIITRRYIEVGETLDIRTQVLSGLEPGQRVVM